MPLGLSRIHMQPPPIASLEAAIGERVLSTDALAGPDRGSHSHVFIVRTLESEYVMRIPKGSQGFCTRFVESHIDRSRWFDQRWATELARELGIPAPRIIYSSRQDPQSPVKFVVMERLPGVAINSAYEQWHGCPYNEAHFGAILRKLHATPVAGAGPIDDSGRTYFPSWNTFLQAMADQAMQMCLTRGSIDDRLYEGLRNTWYPLLDELADVAPRLLHLESLGFSNILYDPATRKITGLLDYEDCIGGDPLFEFAWMYYYFGNRASGQKYFSYGRLLEGYGDHSEPESRLAVYSPFMWLDKLSWIRPDSARADGYRQRLTAVCQGQQQP
jgi:aminoglycoside phosphotransferase (APT) family kinase protein